MSLRWRIMGAMVFVIFLTAVINIGVGYYTTQSRLGVLVERMGGDEAVQLAQNLSREYSAAGGWETVEMVLSDAGFIYDGIPEGERHEESKGESAELFHKDPVRIVIVGVDGRVVMDNLSELSPGTAAPNLEGHRETVFNVATNQPVGHVYVNVNQEFLSTESHGLLNALLFITLFGGLLTAGIVILLSAWLSNRITAPVRALTKATQTLAQGETTELPVTSSDELGRMSAAFNRLTTTLESQRDLRKRLIDDVSHELNTPLSVIHLEAKGLRDGLQTPEDASETIIQEVDRLRGLVTDLNWLAETDYGELKLTLEAGSMHELLTAEVDRWQPQTQVRQIELSLQASSGLPDMCFDRMRMSQALGNVISNAIQSAESGGNIVLRAGLVNNEELAVSVSDDGIGIDAADLPYVFDRFYSSENSRTRGYVGTGLGLAITRAIVEAHGGTVVATSDGLGKGVTVTIRFPLHRQAPSSSTSDTTARTTSAAEEET